MLYLNRSTVADLSLLLDAVPTDGVPHHAGGLVEEAAVEALVVEPRVEVVDAALAPAGGRVEGDDRGHDARGLAGGTAAVGCGCEEGRRCCKLDMRECVVILQTHRYRRGPCS